MIKKYYVYITTNKTNRVLYTGVSNDLIRRIYQHKNKSIPGFTSKYNVDKLVYYETYDGVIEAITREKQIKAGSRAKKIALIKSVNPIFEDLYPNLVK